MAIKNGGARKGAGRKLGEAARLKRAELAPLVASAMAELQKAVDRSEPWAIKIVANRQLPNLKPASALIEAGLITGDSMAQRAESIVIAATEGKISATIAGELLAGIGQHARVVETFELVERIAVLENTSKAVK